MITWRKAESWLWVQDINVQKNQQMLSSFFFSACEVLKAGSSVKLILPHANCEFIMLVHADSRFASPIRLITFRRAHVMQSLTMQQQSHSGNVQMVKSMWLSKMANLTPYGTSLAWLIMQLRVSWFSRQLVLSMQTNTQVRLLHSMIASMDL